jgi:internalin A
MIEIASYPFPDYQDDNGEKYTQYKMLTMSSNDIDEAIDIVKQNKIDIIHISPAHGFTRGNLDFIQNMKNLFGIDIFDSKNIDISAIERCDHLKFIRISQTPQPIDLSHLSGLAHLAVTWHRHLTLPSPQKSNLKSLLLSGYKYKTLESLPYYRNLVSLSMHCGSITSLIGLERFQSLKLYHHMYGRNLCDIRPLTKLHLLEDVMLEHCKKIRIEGILEQCKKLKVLKYFACPNLPNLSFLQHLKDIEFFSFSNVNIEDGDMTPLLKLKYFGFYPDKKHYSHTCNELRKIYQERGLGIIHVHDENSGFYTITFDNGTEYHGEGGVKQAKTMAKKIEEEFKIKHTGVQWSATKPSGNSSDIN